MATSMRQKLFEMTLEDSIHCGLEPCLAQELWGWVLCAQCLQNQTCITSTCPLDRVAKLKRYFLFFRTAVATYHDSCQYGEASISFSRYRELFKAVQFLRDHPQATRDELRNYISRAPKPGSSDQELSEATELLVKILVMVDCTAPLHMSNRLEMGGNKNYWGHNVPFKEYLRQVFPAGSSPALKQPGNDLLLDMTSELKGRKLVKHLGITFRATHNIGNHLRFYKRQNVLEIYHHAAFVKEQLRLSQDPGVKSVTASLLPRQLLLEVLDSLQGVLFPLSDPKSKKLLQSLVSTNSFDPDILNFEFSSIRRPEEETISYIYLADRFSELYSELQNPRPRGWLDRKMERRSGARHVMMATLLGVLFAILLGIVSLAVTSYQTWIAYQAWQHPVPLSFADRESLYRSAGE